MGFHLPVHSHRCRIVAADADGRCAFHHRRLFAVWLPALAGCAGPDLAAMACGRGDRFPVAQLRQWRGDSGRACGCGLGRGSAGGGDGAVVHAAVRFAVRPPQLAAGVGRYPARVAGYRLAQPRFQPAGQPSGGGVGGVRCGGVGVRFGVEQEPSFAPRPDGQCRRDAGRRCGITVGQCTVR